MGSDESHINVSVGSDRQSHKTVSTDHKPCRTERRAEAVSNRGTDKDCVGVWLHTREGKRGWEGRRRVQRGEGGRVLGEWGGGAGPGGKNTDPMGESHEALGEVQL